MHSYVLMLFQSNTSEAGSLPVFVFGDFYVRFEQYLPSKLRRPFGKWPVFFGKCGDGVLFLAFDLCLLSLSSLVERFCF